MIDVKEQVIQTHLTAQINAMNTLLSYYNSQISDPNNTPELVEKARYKRRLLIKQIDEIIGDLKDVVGSGALAGTLEAHDKAR